MKRNVAQRAVAQRDVTSRVKTVIAIMKNCDVHSFLGNIYRAGDF